MQTNRRTLSKRPPGRPKLPEGLRRCERVTVRFTRDELRRIEAAARSLRLSSAAYLLQLALS